MNRKLSTSGDLYPNCSVVARTIRIRGMSKAELLAALQTSGVQLNEYGRALFADDRFTTLPSASQAQTVEVSVEGMGFPKAALFAEIGDRAAALGLSLCPLEVGPHLRLQFLDQPEGAVGFPLTSHRAPPGAITVASEPISDDDKTPKGLYLRRIEGVLWLRGYRASADNVWNPEDRLVFCRAQPAMLSTSG